MDPASFMLRKKESKFLEQLEKSISKFIYGPEAAKKEAEGKSKTGLSIPKVWNRQPILELDFSDCLIQRSDVEEMERRVANHVEEDDDYENDKDEAKTSRPKQEIYLSFDDCILKNSNATTALVVFCSHYNITRLDLTGCSFESKSMARLVKACNPPWLALSVPQPTDGGREAVRGHLGSILQECSDKKLRVLKLNAGLEAEDDDDGTDDEENANNIDNKKEVKTSNGVIAIDSISELVAAFADSIAQIESFSLTDCALNDEGVSLLAGGLLSVRSTLQKVDLRFEMAPPAETNPIAATLQYLGKMFYAATEGKMIVGAAAATGNDDNEMDTATDGSSILLQSLGNLLMKLPLIDDINLEISNWDKLFYVPAQEVADSEAGDQELDMDKEAMTTIEMVRQFCQAFQKCKSRSIRLKLSKVGLTEDSALRLLGAAAQNHHVSDTGGTGGGAGICLELLDDTAFLSKKSANSRLVYQMATLIPHGQRLAELKFVDMAPTAVETVDDKTEVGDETATGSKSEEDASSSTDAMETIKVEDGAKATAATEKDEISDEEVSYWWTLSANQDLLVEAVERNTSLQKFDVQVNEQDVLSVQHWKRIATTLKRNQELKRISDGFDDVFDTGL
mmetsp:Transcript_26383/g.72845  ORF Transcript_26383/g.72845 Transcript_26383/m.72845 type:complete len:623 (-) Transcript_26383:1495-3363(-)|eukprot:CAMPEP_0168748936 /NCGR_PEP_ID=MMETSP0724-20121128/16439_1 /TAXON_ID=265536 /ORGANISM="Amphiprora sp., Strain CCMP467" /LENGTH=622 /DNA_ID=CAMNT_0008796793 /DNA_START=24 /DNA_END=1892 /DNA_ORIENTATION=+